MLSTYCVHESQDKCIFMHFVPTDYQKTFQGDFCWSHNILLQEISFVQKWPASRKR